MTPTNFQVRDEKVEHYLKVVAEAIKVNLPAGMGFTLLMFDYGDGGNMFYTSTAKREDMIKAMKEFISKQE